MRPERGLSPFLNTISAENGLSIADAVLILSSAPRRYKSYYIPKRAGGLRLISQPAREVKALQYWFMASCQKRLKVHPAASAYRKGRGIRRNAAAHRDGNYILKMDFADFFPSIRAADIRAYLRALAPCLVDENDIEWIVRLVCFRSKEDAGLRLSIGAPSSPWLSNVLMFEFDRRVSKACVGTDVVYTRYADDVTFSSSAPDALRQTEERVRRIVAELETPKLIFNSKKTIMLSRRMQRRVTGLVISNEGAVSLGRARKRMIRAAVHHMARGLLNEEAKLRLRGLLAFAQDVEPEFVERLSKRFEARVGVSLASRF